MITSPVAPAQTSIKPIPQPWSEFRGHVANARTSTERAIDLIHTSLAGLPAPGVDPSAGAVLAASDAIGFLGQALATDAPADALHAARAAQGELLRGVGANQTRPFPIDLPAAKGHFDSALNWLNIAESLTTVYTIQ